VSQLFLAKDIAPEKNAAKAEKRKPRIFAGLSFFL
jgi:hypothetical protein